MTPPLIHDADPPDRDELLSLRARPFWVRWIDDGSTFVLTRFLVLRLLGGVYFVAFLSTLLQGRALVGEHGLLPMAGYLEAVARMSGSRSSGFLSAPSLFWLDASDGALVAVALAGAALSFAVVLGLSNAGAMLVLWILQLSLYDVGQIFWGYGWELQLLETGMLAVVLCPLRTWVDPALGPAQANRAPPTVVVWLFRWLVVRVMLGAGLIKLRGDPCWRDLTCLITHYETQPNPSPVSWLFHQLPPAAHAIGVLFNHFVELVVPAFVFGPRWTRRVAGAFFVGFQLLLIASGNLSFLNWLTLVPALACFDDALLVRLVPRRLQPRVRARTELEPKDETPLWHRRVANAYGVLVCVLSIGPVTNLLSSRQAMNASFDPLHLVNTYGAFGTVSRVRDEIVLEGTRDQSPTDDARWEEYELPCKPGDVRRRPCLVSPYHYRLDWQMWFAAMTTYEEEPWIAALVDKLLRGERAVVPLFAVDPFRDGPPRFVRARLYRYELTSWREPRDVWWRRRLLTPADRPGGSEYMRPLSVGDPELDAFLKAHRLR
jgi:hypothetical protein